MAGSSTSPGRSGDLAGRLLVGRYRLNKPIASGGMAQVWEATDEVLARRVAVKLLHGHLADDESFVKRFRAEAIAAARLAHPSIVSVYDTFSEDGLEAIVMELVSGTTMRADLDAHGPLRLDAVLAIGSQVADALGAAHASGLVHRDVKPANILLSADGRVLVADFGIAKAAEGNDLTSDGSMVGTAKYLAPEQVEGTRIDGRADLYSLGIVLYEALTGQPPFVAETDAGTALARLHRDPVPPRRLRPDVPEAVESVVMCAMARDPNRRFANASAMRRALLAAGADPRRAGVAAQAANTGERPVVPPTALRSPPMDPSPPRPPAHLAEPPTSATVAVRRPGPQTAPAAQLPPAGRADAHVQQVGATGGPEHPAAPTRRSPLLIVAVLAVLGLLVGGGLWFGMDAGTPSTGSELAIVEARPYDPDGRDGERNDLVPLAIDGDVETAWRTETYNDAPRWPAGKSGVGLVVKLDGTKAVDGVVVSTPTDLWEGQVFTTAAEEFPVSLAGWGDGTPLSGVSDGVTSASFERTEARWVLVWITSIPAEAKFVEVAEVTVQGT